LSFAASDGAVRSFALFVGEYTRRHERRGIQLQGRSLQAQPEQSCPHNFLESPLSSYLSLKRVAPYFRRRLPGEPECFSAKIYLMPESVRLSHVMLTQGLDHFSRCTPRDPFTSTRSPFLTSRLTKSVTGSPR
jgi:hypothetical protein